jgi:hypothetical protein
MVQEMIPSPLGKHATEIKYGGSKIVAEPKREKKFG